MTVAGQSGEWPAPRPSAKGLGVLRGWPCTSIEGWPFTRQQGLNQDVVEEQSATTPWFASLRGYAFRSVIEVSPGSAC